MKGVLHLFSWLLLLGSLPSMAQPNFPESDHSFSHRPKKLNETEFPRYSKVPQDNFVHPGAFAEECVATKAVLSNQPPQIVHPTPIWGGKEDQRLNNLNPIPSKNV